MGKRKRAGVERKRRVIIDTDPGIDDCLALLHAFGSSGEISVDGLTIVCGNGKDVPISLGVPPETNDEEDQRAEDAAATPQQVMVHGTDSLGNVAERFEQTESDFQGFHSKAAPEYLYETCLASPGEITLVCIGPLTNVAEALAAHPDLQELVEEVVVMGGAVTGTLRGNRTPAAEANFAHDPEAAQAVLTAGFKNVVLADLGVTHQTDICMLRDACLKQVAHRWNMHA